MAKSKLQKELDQVSEQCKEGLRVDHECPATFALAAILVRINDIKAQVGSLERSATESGQ